MVYPKIEDESICHEMGNLPPGCILGLEIWNQKWIGS